MGCYYLTMEEDGCRGEGKVFANLDEVSLAYELGKVDLHAKVRILRVRERRTARKHPVETTVGRAIFNQILPDELRYVDEVLDKGRLKDLVAKCYQQLGLEPTTELVDKIKALASSMPPGQVRRSLSPT